MVGKNNAQSIRTFQYDGTNYSGWQIQPNGVTIEQKLNEALQALLGEDVSGCGKPRSTAG